MDLIPEPAGLPPGYPQEYQQEMALRDGRRVLIRPVQTSDAPELADAIETADRGTLHRRFMGGPPRVTPKLRAAIAVAACQVLAAAGEVFLLIMQYARWQPSLQPPPRTTVTVR